MSSHPSTIKQNIFGKQLSYNEVKNFNTIEVFKNTTHDTRALEQDENGTFYLYDFHEKVNFSGGDEIIEHFFVLENEEQGRKYAHADIITLKSELTKFIWIGPGYEMVAIGE